MPYLYSDEVLTHGFMKAGRPKRGRGSTGRPCQRGHGGRGWHSRRVAAGAGGFGSTRAAVALLLPARAQALLPLPALLLLLLRVVPAPPRALPAPLLRVLAGRRWCC